ncbi:hypothetical protein vseg_015944 [Gypsophila vaccaria]
MIEINHASSATWVFDTGCGSDLCNHLQGLRDVPRLTKGEIDLPVYNEARVVAVSIGTYVLNLLSGFVLHLKNCHFLPTLSKNIIFVSMLDMEGFTFNIKDNSFIFSLNDLVYGKAVSMNDIYVLDRTTDIYHVNTNKRVKVGDKYQTYLWHCRTGHINEKCVKKLIKNGTISPFDYESFGTCESCLIGKMTRISFKGIGMRASDLLGLIHIDVCGTMSITARGRSRPRRSVL